MTPRILSWISVTAVLWTATAVAQQNVSIQLPTFNFTTVQTTVSVPDGGTGLLGGVMRGSEGSVERGVPLLDKLPYVNRLFKNRGIGREFNTSNMTVIPRIIIQEEEEFLQTGVSADMLSDQTAAYGRPAGAALATARRSPADLDLARKAAFLSNNLARRADAEPALIREPKVPSVEDIRRQNQLAKSERKSEAAEYFAKGTRAEAEGKPGVAKVFYQMAARRAEGDLQQQIAARLLVLQGSKDGTRLAGQ